MELNSLLTVIITVSLLTFGLYLTITSIAKNYFEKQQWDNRRRNSELIVPLRLQAYERMCLFLERITPDNLVVRLSGAAENAAEFHHMLLKEIREEYNHNLAQQLYMSHAAWGNIKKAMHDTVALINRAAEKAGKDASPTEMGRQIFQLIMENDEQATEKALKFLKEEIQAVF